MPDEELTPEDCCRPALEVDELPAVDVPVDEEPVDEAVDCVVPDDPAVDGWLPDEAGVPGFVSALAAPNRATAATDARPATTVSRLRRRSAVSRAAALSWVVDMGSMPLTLLPGAKPKPRAG